MIAGLISEFRKFFSTRLWWVILLVAFGYVSFVAGMFAFLFHYGASQTPGGAAMADLVGLAKIIYGIAASQGFVFPLLIGTMSVTGEFRHQTITPTFLAEPRRWRVLVAKLISCVPLGAVYGVVTMAGAVLVGGGLLALFGYDTGLSESSTWETLGRGTLAPTIWALVGVGLGVLLKNQVAAIIVVLAFTQFVEPMIRAVPLMTGHAFGFVSYLPSAAGEAIVGSGSIYSSMTTSDNPTTSVNTLLPMWGGIGVLLAYAVVFGVIGYFTTLRRDVS